MSKQFSAQDILNAKEVHLYDNGILYVVDKDDEAYGFCKGSTEWFRKENFWDYFGPETMMSYISSVTKEEAVQMYLTWTKDEDADSNRLDRAIVYAVKKHAGQFRKGTVKPYITHPLETMQILNSMKADNNLLMAGVLHDTVEDTNATEEEIRELFGDDVADLVCAHSEDKSKTWEERKQHTIDELATADRRLQMLVMADKVANLRSMAADYKEVGFKLWYRFNAPETKQAWYYSGIQDALYHMQDDTDCAAVYWEMVGLFKDLFVKFYFDPEQERLYQICSEGTKYYLEKGDPEWKELTEDLPESRENIERLRAERMEDNWFDEFWQRCKQDRTDAFYNIYSSKKRTIDIRIQCGKLTLACEDHGPECGVMTGSDEYEFYYELDQDGTWEFLKCLRVEHGLAKEFPDLLKEAFGKDDGPVWFVIFCEINKIEHRMISI